MIRDQHVNPFIRATADVLKLQAGVDLAEDRSGSYNFNESNLEVRLIMGFTGRLNGSVSIGMSEATAQNIASAMTNSDLTDKKLLGNVITALGAAITSEASLELRKMGFECWAPFPTVVVGQSFSISTPVRDAECICLNSSYGHIELKASLLERKTCDMLHQVQAG